jgi:TonB family protein
MFDFAISRNRHEKPAKRLFASGIASSIAHLLVLILLIEFPQLLKGGMYDGWRKLVGKQPEDEFEKLRLITDVGDPRKMMLPSDATLRKLLAAMEKKGPGMPPLIQIRPEDRAAQPIAPPVPKIQEASQKPNLLIPDNILSPAISSPAPVTGALGAGAPGAGNSPSSLAPQIGSTAGKPALSGLSSLGSPKQIEIAAIKNVAPNIIPPSTKSPVDPIVPPSDIAKKNPNDQNSTSGKMGGKIEIPGITKGEYVSLIEDKIRQQWFIPSNLLDSRGNATITFLIHKNGQATDINVSEPSGNFSFDNAARLAVLNARPFPPLPPDYHKDAVPATYYFYYNEPH